MYCTHDDRLPNLPLASRPEPAPPGRMLNVTAPAPVPAADAVVAYGTALSRLAAATALPADFGRRPYFATSRRAPAQAPAPDPAPAVTLEAVLLALAGRCVCCVAGVGWGGCG